jgi:tetratricopeptide (TPR) repeat protein
MSQFRFARLFMMLAAVGLNVASTSAQAQKAPMPSAATTGQPAPRGSTAAPAATPPADSVRPEIFKLMDPAGIKPLLEQKNYTEVQSRITQADAIAEKTPYEIYVIDRTKYVLAAATSNDQMAMTALEAILATNRLQGEELGGYVYSLAQLYFNNKNYPKAVEALKRFQTVSKTPEKARNLLVRSYYLNNDFAAVKTELTPVVAAAEAAGTPPAKEDLGLLSNVAVQQKDDAGYLVVQEKLATFYPSDEIWHGIINRGVTRKPGFNSQLNAINMYRLESTAVSKMSAEDYVEFAELALEATSPTEAKKIVDAGFAKGVLGVDANAAKQKQLRDRATKSAADDAKNIAAGEASASKAKTGAGLVNLGWAYSTMDQYDKGITMMQQGIAKGGLKAPEEAKLRLGVAQARAGKKADAIATFQGIKGGGGAGDLAKYWILLLNSPTAANLASK